MPNPRPMQFPRDIDNLLQVSRAGFQYPENPEWSIQADELEGMVDNLNGIKRLWPLIAFLQIVSTDVRDIAYGFFYDEDNQPVGTIMYNRRSGGQEWYISNVTVLPPYRRRGIARKLVQATLDTIRSRQGQKAILDVIDGNTPAYSLYKELGFEDYSGSAQFFYEQTPPQPIFPEGYTISPLPERDWRTRYAFENRITPDIVRKYTPVSEANFQQPFFITAAFNVINQVGGWSHKSFMVRRQDTDVVAIASYEARTRPGGVNTLQAKIDPAHPALALPLLSYLLSAIQRTSQGHRIELHFASWQPALIDAARALGASQRYVYHRMGLVF